MNSSTIATFAVKLRDSDTDVAIIIKPGSYSYQPKTVVATHWKVSAKSFDIKAPVGNISRPVDLMVWGSDVRSLYGPAVPLAVRSIGYIN